MNNVDYNKVAAVLLHVITNRKNVKKNKSGDWNGNALFSFQTKAINALIEAGETKENAEKLYGEARRSAMK